MISIPFTGQSFICPQNCEIIQLLMYLLTAVVIVVVLSVVWLVITKLIRLIKK